MPFPWVPERNCLSTYIWDKVSKNGPSKNCGRQPLKKLKGYGQLKQTISLQIFLSHYDINDINTALQFNKLKHLIFRAKKAQRKLQIQRNKHKSDTMKKTLVHNYWWYITFANNVFNKITMIQIADEKELRCLSK